MCDNFITAIIYGLDTLLYYITPSKRGIYRYSCTYYSHGFSLSYIYSCLLRLSNILLCPWAGIFIVVLYSPWNSQAVKQTVVCVLWLMHYGKRSQCSGGGSLWCEILQRGQGENSHYGRNGGKYLPTSESVSLAHKNTRAIMYTVYIIYFKCIIYTVPSVIIEEWSIFLLLAQCSKMLDLNHTLTIRL